MNGERLTSLMGQARMLQRLSSTGSATSNRYCRASFSSQSEMQACRRISVSSAGSSFTGSFQPWRVNSSRTLEVLQEDLAQLSQND
jgi:hypothetical protein